MSWRPALPLNVTVILPPKEPRQRYRVERIPSSKATFQPEQGKTYRCPRCGSPIYTTYTGDAEPRIVCDFTSHSIRWPVQE